MALRYKVRNWEKYQHYSKRNPPWVKLHFELLASEDWVSLSDASRVLAVVCMLLASRNDGFVPADPLYLKRVAYLNTEPDFTELLRCRFLEDASTLGQDASIMLAHASNVVDDASISASASASVSEDESVREGASEAASLAMSFHFHVPGLTKPLLPDLEAHFAAKLVWLRSSGRNETEFIAECIQSPKRDKSEATSIGKMFLFWKFCEEQSNGREFSGTGKGKSARTPNGVGSGSPMSAGGGRYEGIKPRIASDD